MGRPKIQLKLIEDERQRNTTYRKRKEGLKKKTYELATLCGIQALLVCIGPTGEVETWPENKQEVQSITAKYRSLSIADQYKHKLDLAGYLTAQINKHRAELNRKANDQLARLLDSRLESVRERIKLLSEQNGLQRNKDNMAIETFEEMNNTIWQDYNQNDVGFCYPYEPMGFDPCQVAMDGFSEYSYGAPTGFGPQPVSAELLPVIPPENSIGLFDNFLLTGGGGEEINNYNFGFDLDDIGHPFDSLRNDPSKTGIGGHAASSNDTPWLFATKP